MKAPGNYVSKMFNGTPNISLKKIVEIAYKLGLEIELVIKKEQSPIFQVEHIQPVIIINKNIPLISEDKGIPKINEKDIFIETIKISESTESTFTPVNVDSYKLTGTAWTTSLKN